MRISLLIKTIQPDEIECGKEMVFRPKALEKADFTDKMTGPAIGGQWCSRPVLTNGKRPKRQVKPLDSVTHIAQLFIISHYK